MAAKNCEDCGVKLTMLNRHMKYREKCHPCGHKEFVRVKARLCSYCGAQIDRAEKSWKFKDGSGFLCDACHEDPKRLEEHHLCSDCGGQLGEKSWRLKDGSGFVCNACWDERKKKAEPRFCSDCGTQIDTAEKHWILKDGSGFVCNACWDERKKKAAERVGKSVTYVGGFSGVTLKQEVWLKFENTEVIVENIPLRSKNKKVLWVMPYNKIKSLNIETGEHLTATRLLLVGILAFGLKKKDRYLVASFEDQNGMMQNPVFEGGGRSGIDIAQKEIYKRIEQARAQLSTIDHQPQKPQESPIDITEQIKKLGALRDQGLLTEQEFESKKQELLARM